MKAVYTLMSVPALALLLISYAVAVAAPRAAVDGPTFNFGSLAHGKSIEHVFVLKNTGDMPLNIGAVSTSCGCTVADVSTRSVAPGKTAEIKVKFNSAGFSGSINKTVHIQTNDPNTPVYTLTVKGTVIKDVEVTPKQLQLGTIKIGTSKEATVKVENRGKQPVTITSVRSTAQQLTVKTGKVTLKPGATAGITVKMTPRADDRFLGAYLMIRTDSPSNPETIIPVFATATK